MLRSVAFHLLVAFAWCVVAPHAQAQCTATPGPWPTCTVWPGPPRSVVSTGTTNQYAWSALDDIDPNGNGLNDFGQLYGANPAITLSTGTGFNTQSFTSANPNCYAGNFDGSGRTSVACPNKGQILYATSNGTSLNTFTTTAITPNTNIWSNRFIVNAGGTAPYPVNPCMVMDVNGDGADDLVCGGAGGPIDHDLTEYPSHTPTSTNWGVYLATGTGFTYHTWPAPAGDYSYGFACVPGEFDGDGMQDLACNYGNPNGSAGSTWIILHATGTGWLAETWTGGPTGPIEVAAYAGGCTFVTSSVGVCPVSCVPGDFNGDGLGDIACDNGNNTWTIGFSGKSGGFMSTATWSGATVPHQLVTVASLFCDVSDIYGVGRTGILCNFMAGSASWTYLGSTGTGFTTTNFTTPFTVGASSGPFDQMTLSSGCVISDLNGDGIKDAACVQPAGSGTSGTGNWNMALSSRPN